MKTTHTDSQPIRYMLTEIEHAYFAIEILSLTEIIPVPELYPVPDPVLAGISQCVYRGQVCGVIDAKRILFGFDSQITTTSRLAIQKTERGTVGILVDDISGVIPMYPHQWKESAIKLGHSYIRGQVQELGAILVTRFETDMVLALTYQSLGMKENV